MSNIGATDHQGDQQSLTVDDDAVKLSSAHIANRMATGISAWAKRGIIVEDLRDTGVAPIMRPAPRPTPTDARRRSVPIPPLLDCDHDPLLPVLPILRGHPFGTSPSGLAPAASFNPER